MDARPDLKGLKLAFWWYCRDERTKHAIARIKVRSEEKLLMNYAQPTYPKLTQPNLYCAILDRMLLSSEDQGET